MKSLKLLAAACLAIALVGCSRSKGKGENQWSVEGTIDGGSDQTVYLARYLSGQWVVIDSTTVDNDGSFSIIRNRMNYPDTYLLALGNDFKNTIEFPIDSVETVTIKASATAFGAGELAGSKSADLFNKVNDIIGASVKEKGTEATIADVELKRRLYDEIIMTEPGNLAAFYVINKVIDGKPLFDPSRSFDFNIIRAVANLYNQYRPADPRTAALKQLVRPKGQVIAEEIGFPDISLMGLDGNNRNLSELVGNGKPVILCFTAYSLDNAPALNTLLSLAYGQGDADVYQVSFDNNEMTWRETANNLPWTCVYNTANDGDRVLRTYNVGAIPTLFIIDRDGKIAERIEGTSISDLQSIIKKY